MGNADEQCETAFQKIFEKAALPSIEELRKMVEERVTTTIPSADKIVAVKQQILTAFPLGDPPAARDLLWAVDRSQERTAAEAIRHALAGKKWNELSFAYLKQHWASFCYLSRYGYRYYLPALLVAGLEHAEQAASCTLLSTPLSRASMHSVTRVETPGSRNKSRCSTRPSSVSWLHILTLTFDEVPKFQALAAQALKWGWNRVETPGLRQTLDYYTRMHTYRRPEPADATVRLLIHTIEETFAATPYPGDHALYGSTQGNEPAECAMEFRGRHWRTLHPTFLAHSAACLSFFTPQAFWYFLPAYVIADLMDADLAADPVFHLTDGLTNWHASDEIAGRPYALKRLADFTTRERQAIVMYLEYRAQKDSYSRAEIQQALVHYWTQPAR